MQTIMTRIGFFRFYWMEGIRDWCISRQLWWGHRVPAYLVQIKVIFTSYLKYVPDWNYAGFYFIQRKLTEPLIVILLKQK
jgi:valyl-tRNA synthetase